MVLNLALASLALGCAFGCVSCAARVPRASAAEAPAVALAGDRGEAVDVRSLARRAPLTVLVFFSPECHCLAVHEPRLRALFERDHPRGVEFAMVDSEVSGTPERDLEEARERGYPFPILRDRGAKLAEALGARYASYAVVLDSTARVRYHGGIDSDRTHLHDQATPYLADAIDDLLANREPRISEGKTLGCALQTW